MLAVVMTCGSCNKSSELYDKPLVMATGATYTETSQGPPLPGSNQLESFPLVIL